MDYYHRRRRILCLTYLYWKSLKTRRPTRSTIRKRNREIAFNNLTAEMRLKDTESFHNFYSMTPQLFDKLLGYVHDDIKKTNVHNAITGSERLALTLRYLATGESMASMSQLFRIGKSTVPFIIREVCTAICKILTMMVMKPFTEENFLQIAAEFEEKWDFPHCVGALGGKHVVMQTCQNSGLENIKNNKGTESLVLFAVCDVEYNFIVVDIDTSNRRSDEGLFKSSKLASAFAENTLPVPRSKCFSEGATPMPYVIVGDKAFPLANYLMTPYPGKIEDLEEKENTFNCRISGPQKVIEKCFEIMSARFRIFHRPILCNREGVVKIIQATVCLHNFLNKHSSQSVPTTTGYMKGLEALQYVTQAGTNDHSELAETVRNEFAEYFVKKQIVG